MDEWYFDSWESLARTALITVAAYILLIVMLRSSGKRTLSKMNAFDMIITIAMGSTLANVTLNKDVALLDGLLALFLMIYLQYAITWLNARSGFMRRLVRSSATLLAYRGRMFRDVMREQRVTEEEIHEAARAEGCTSMDQLKAVVLETTGKLTIIKELDGVDEVLAGVEGYPNRG
jgi:uncharacterized membrane protein YcaP (DUF421 family)